MSDITIRPGRTEDSEACFHVMWEATADLLERSGTALKLPADEVWPVVRPLYEHFAQIAAQWWVAEDPSLGLVGSARSIERDGLFELTELHVRPDCQSEGIGGGLLERAFPAGRGELRHIIATTDLRALARYYAAGTVVRFPILCISGAPGAPGYDGPVEALRLAHDDSEALEAVCRIEREVLGRTRGQSEMAWLSQEREGYRYRLDGEEIGVGFVGASGTGPIATIRPEHMVDVLTHLETRAHDLAVDPFEIYVPSVNETAVRHLLARGLRLEAFLTFAMSNRAFGQFDRFVGFGPPLML